MSEKLISILTERAEGEGLPELRALLDELSALRVRVVYHPPPGDCCAGYRLELARARDEAVQAKGAASAIEAELARRESFEAVLDARKDVTLARLRESVAVLQGRLDAAQERADSAEAAHRRAARRAEVVEEEIARLREHVAQTRAGLVRELLARLEG